MIHKAGAVVWRLSAMTPIRSDFHRLGAFHECGVESALRCLAEGVICSSNQIFDAVMGQTSSFLAVYLTVAVVSQLECVAVYACTAPDVVVANASNRILSPRSRRVSSARSDG